MSGSQIMALIMVVWLFGFGSALFMVWLQDLKRDAEKWRRKQ